MEDLLVDIDDDVLARLEREAAAKGVTVEDHARAILAASTRNDPPFSFPSRSDGEGDRPKGGGGGDSVEEVG